MCLNVYILSMPASTRALYEKKLMRLLQSDGHNCLNGAEKDALYSDSEEEEEGMTKNALHFFLIVSRFLDFWLLWLILW